VICSDLILRFQVSGGGRISSPNFFAISIPRGMVFADGHHGATLGWMQARRSSKFRNR
jgi:hypothetical protein